MTERQAYIAFNLTENVGSVTLGRLMEGGNTAVEAWKAYPKKVSRSGGEIDWEGEEKLAKRFGVHIITMIDDDYPEMLRTMPGSPLVLYVKGDLSVFSKPAIALVGTRRATDYGKTTANRFAYDLASAGWAVVSGLALGIDAASHRGALDAKGATIGVIGSGLDRFYPEENRELAREMVKNGGAVVSEFPFGRSADQTTFPIRNHVVAALAKGVIAIEAPFKSGTLITTSIAADLGRTVMAVPGRVTDRMSSGCLQLIRDGAIAVRNVDDVFEAVGGIGIPFVEGACNEASLPACNSSQNADTPPVYSIEESLVLHTLEDDPVALDDLARLTKLPIEKVSSIAMTLRIKGALKFMPGNRVQSIR